MFTAKEMADFYFLNYALLGYVLKKLQESPQVQTSPELLETVRLAVMYYQQLPEEFHDLLKAHRALAKEVVRLKTPPGQRIEGEDGFAHFEPYERLRDVGATPSLVARVVRADGFDRIGVIRALRQVFQMSLAEALEVIDRPEPDGAATSQ